MWGGSSTPSVTTTPPHTSPLRFHTPSSSNTPTCGGSRNDAQPTLPSHIAGPSPPRPTSSRSCCWGPDAATHPVFAGATGAGVQGPPAMHRKQPLVPAPPTTTCSGGCPNTTCHERSCLHQGLPGCWRREGRQGSVLKAPLDVRHETASQLGCDGRVALLHDSCTAMRQRDSSITL